jgi:pyruvate formate lyase activating enzyme
MKQEAMLYEQKGPMLHCLVCHRNCIIPKNKRGFCDMRENDGAKLFTLNYGLSSSMAVDPVEKKPLYHFYPGSQVFSLGTIGCNFRCKFCQNWTISQAKLDEIPLRELTPEESIELTQKYDCLSLAWTYNEPTMWFEFTYDSAKIAQKNNIKTIYVTNGYMGSEALDLISPHLDAANIDLKGMSNRFYQDLCDARLEPVLENIRTMYEKKIHIEITNLLIPGYNDSKEYIKALVTFLAEEVGVEVPLHFSRFHPDYQLTDIPATSVKALETAKEIANNAGMLYVYIGNVPGHDGENSRCYDCGELLIRRNGFQTSIESMKNNKCPQCGAKMHFVV